MTPHTFVFIGRSGCGKGTQADLLCEYLKKIGGQEIFYLETGQKFRDFIATTGYTNALAKEIQENGELQPSFLAVWMWGNILIEKLESHEHLVIDGTPRKLGEAIIFNEAMKFYGRHPIIVYINVSRDWSETRLLERKRSDDKDDEIKKRLDWFETDVLPAVEYFRTNQDVTFLDINGERAIADIHADLVSRLNLA